MLLHYMLMSVTVCIGTLERFLETVPDDEKGDKEKIEKRFQKYCKDAKGKDHKFVCSSILYNSLKQKVLVIKEIKWC